MCILLIVGMFYSGVVWCVLLFFFVVFAAATVVVHLKNLIDWGEVLFRSCLCVCACVHVFPVMFFMCVPCASHSVGVDRSVCALLRWVLCPTRDA